MLKATQKLTLIARLHDYVDLLQLPGYSKNFFSYSNFYPLSRIVEQLPLIIRQTQTDNAFW